MYYILSE